MVNDNSYAETPLPDGRVLLSIRFETPQMARFVDGVINKLAAKWRCSREDALIRMMQEASTSEGEDR